MACDEQLRNPRMHPQSDWCQLHPTDIPQLYPHKNASWTTPFISSINLITPPHTSGCIQISKWIIYIYIYICIIVYNKYIILYLYIYTYDYLYMTICTIYTFAISLVRWMLYGSMLLIILIYTVIYVIYLRYQNITHPQSMIGGYCMEVSSNRGRPQFSIYRWIHEISHPAIRAPAFTETSIYGNLHFMDQCYYYTLTYIYIYSHIRNLPNISISSCWSKMVMLNNINGNIYISIYQPSIYPDWSLRHRFMLASFKTPIDSYCEDSVRGLWNDQERHVVSWYGGGSGEMAEGGNPQSSRKTTLYIIAYYT